ncbi:MAG: phosphotransferase [Demequinaceae bacterium]|nr:phosphotransferase [Demequinaceae bacterium]
MPPTLSVPPAEVDINPALIQKLLSDQHSDLADLPLGDRFEGWDNVTIRLGEHLAIRMPRIEAAVPLLERELRWLPEIGEGWEFGAPLPIRIGEPGRDYPWPWCVVPWFDGVDGAVEPLVGEGAEDLGHALRQVHVPAPADAPHTPWRTTPLAERASEVMTNIESFDSRASKEGLTWDGVAARRMLLEAAALPWKAGFWVHADIHLRNIVTRGSRLAAILDWGEAAAGDPAQDLGQAWLLCASDDVSRLFAAYGDTDDDLLLRAKGEAITSALRLLLTKEKCFVESGWQGLVNLSLAEGAPPRA